MNLTKLKEQLLEMGKQIGLQLEEETANQITLHSQIIAKDYFTNSIYFRMTVYESGTLHIFLTFDEMERNYDQLYLINNFNADHPWFKAYIANINDKDYLELHYCALSLSNEEEVTKTFTFLLGDLLNEESLNLLKPILASE